MGQAIEKRPFAAPRLSVDKCVIEFVEVELTIAEVKALRATPKTIAAAPGSGKVAIPLGGMVIYDYAAVYTESSDNLVFKYTNGSGAAVSAVIEATDFLTATSDQLRPIIPVNDAALVANAAIVLHNNGDGEFGGTGSPMRVKLAYLILETGL